MTSGDYLTNQFLIAMPALADPNFQQTVTYICQHNADGAMGLVINRPLELNLGDVLRHLNIDTLDPDLDSQQVYLGGPVQNERGFVLHQPASSAWESTMQITTDTGLTTSRDILRDMAVGHGPGSALVALGYAGWAAGQLEQEIRDNAWLNGPADDAILFELPTEQRWDAAIEALGIDRRLLTAEAGHA